MGLTTVQRYCAACDGKFDPLYRASVKLFRLGVRTPGGLFFGVRYTGVSIFGVFVRQAFPFSAQF